MNLDLIQDYAGVVFLVVAGTIAIAAVRGYTHAINLGRNRQTGEERVLPRGWNGAWQAAAIVLVFWLTLGILAFVISSVGQ